MVAIVNSQTIQSTIGMSLTNYTIEEEYNNILPGFDIGISYSNNNKFFFGLSYGYSQTSNTTEYKTINSNYSYSYSSNHDYKYITDKYEYLNNINDIGLLIGGKHIKFNPSVLINNNTYDNNTTYTNPVYLDSTESENYEYKCVGFALGANINIPITKNVFFNTTAKLGKLYDITDYEDENDDIMSYSSTGYSYYKISTGITFNIDLTK
jgi:hypothetical protein